MNKQEFIEKLRNKLSTLPQQEVEDRIAFYSEMIDDKIEDGILEEDAVNEIGDIDKVVSQILSEISLLKIVKDKVRLKRKLSVWEIILIILGAPIWLSILVSIFSVVLSAYVSLWAGIVCLWSGVVTLCACAVYGIIIGGIMMILGDTFINLVVFGMGMACVGLTIFLCFGCKYATKGLIIFTKISILAIKNFFVKKGENNE